ncbi:MAG: HIT family protein [Bacteroidales bacterium]|nr:HIT family protein [Bacteroidales bacterium]
MESNRCPFCDPDIKPSIFAQSPNFMAVYNIAPVLAGHSMIIPKSHIEHLSELNPELYIEMMEFTRFITVKLCTAFKTNDFNWSLQEGISAGQTVNHLHLHILLRNHGDLNEPGDWYKLLSNSTELDSLNRPRLNKKQISEAVAFLKPHFE